MEELFSVEVFYAKGVSVIDSNASDGCDIIFSAVPRIPRLVLVLVPERRLLVGERRDSETMAPPPSSSHPLSGAGSSAIFTVIGHDHMIDGFLAEEANIRCIQLFCRSQISSGSGSPEAPSEGSGRHVSQMFSRGERSPSLALEVCTGLNWSRSSQTTASAKHQPESLHPLHLAGELELHSYKPLVFLQLVFHIDSIRRETINESSHQEPEKHNIPEHHPNTKHECPAFPVRSALEDEMSTNSVL
ncbi:hypothetical protein DNTS_025784 [Danionella cerebrum]|uniref:Uncharacterized protein n=1 Tax=Danionella cerebrum TaxID=2873325 RepID=A0A553N4L1_9TELE|nr:hypothetical protein DNTS_025784 [Danionella translucida]